MKQKENYQTKIFMPKSIFLSKKNSDLYGEIKVNDERKMKSYYFIEAAERKLGKGDSAGSSKLKHIGQVLKRSLKKEPNLFCFRYDGSKPFIYLVNEDDTQNRDIDVFLYEPEEFRQINPENAINPDDDITAIIRHQGRARNNSNEKKNGHFLYEWMAKPFIPLMRTNFVKTLLKRKCIYEHYFEWETLCETHKRAWNIWLDRSLGVLAMLIILFYLQEPEEYVTNASYLVIEKLRLLLRSLKGSPIGLKLNVHLNNFFLDFFNYHIDLWQTFLNIIEPLIQQIFIPIAMLGLWGLSFQLALLSDLLSIVGLHAHCFYIYSAVLYKVEIRGLCVLWKVVRGKRYSELSKRVESHDYVNRQLYLATIFFATLLFLFPTILVYYVVFTALRLCTFTVNILLRTLRIMLLEFPLQNLYEWLQGKYKDRVYIYIEPQADSAYSIDDCAVFMLSVQSPPWTYILSCKSGFLQSSKTNEELTFKNIVKKMLKGTF